MLIPENYFIFINVAIILIFLSMIVIGYSKGLLYELLSIAYTLGSLFFAWFISPVLASLYPLFDIVKLYPESGLLVNALNINPLLNTIIYFVLVFIVLKILYFIIAVVLKGFNKIPVLGSINKLLGGCLGFINGILITMLISMLFSLPVFSNGAIVKEKTVLKYINRFTEKSINFIVENIDLTNLEKQFQNFNVEESREDFKKLLSGQYE